MESQDDEVINNTNNNNNIGGQSIVKGKRTKRQRPQSPIPFRMITPNSSKSDEGSDICSNDNVAEEMMTTTTMISDDEAEVYYLGGTTTTSTTEEEEEMAHCLILLARGNSRDMDHERGQPQPRSLSLLDNHVINNYQVTSNKFTSRKFMETPTTAGKSGYYVYECKTCSKTFPSFQALGGHRASHKKPKNKEEDNFKSRSSSNNLLSITTPNNNRNITNILLSSDEEDLPFKNIKPSNNMPSSSLSLQLTNRALYNGHHHTKARVHECSICGAEFSSGQALGGHMRRHRGPVNAPALAAPPLAIALPSTMEEVSPAAEQMEDMIVLMKRPRNTSMLSLDLDLNLPAPSEDVVDNQRGPNIVFESKQTEAEQPPPSPPQNHQQQQQLVFSSPTLVDCHY